jgi:outer membrane protein TolC
MQRLTLSTSVLLPCIALSACALQHVPPAPLEPVSSQTAFLQRSLTDTATRELLAQRNIDVSIWPPARWAPEPLVLAALPRHPATAQARARADLARAQLQTAGLTPRTILSPEIEHTNERDAGQSAWSVGLALDLALTGASVREARIERARLLADAALLDEADTAWSVRSAAQRALIELWAASAEMTLLDRLVAAQREAQAIMHKRYALGAADALELTATRTATAQAESRYVLAEQRQLRARGDLAQALALPLSSIDALQIDFSAFDTPPPLPAAGVLRAGATLDRIDLRRALARHAAAEAALTIELRAQYPEIRIKPGLLWDQGATVWQLGASLPLFAAARQAGPIAEAVARRDLATQDFLALQAQALIALDHARTRVRAAELDTDGVAAELDEAHLQATRTEQRYTRGDADRLERLLARARVFETDIRLLHARQRTLVSRLALEDAMQRPLSAMTTATENTP